MKLLVVEDDLRVSELLQRGLTEANFDIQLAYDGKSAERLFASGDFDLIITDIILPKVDGIEFCKRIKSKTPSVPIIMLTALGTTDDKVEGFDAGADDYLVKPFEMRELIARINALLKRKSYSNQPERILLQFADLEMNLHTKEVKRMGQDINLTPKEFKLLKFMMENPERVLSRQEISKKVWEMDFDTGTNFIDVYINYLRKKVDKNFNQKLIHTKTGMGFVLKN